MYVWGYKIKECVAMQNRKKDVAQLFTCLKARSHDDTGAVWRFLNRAVKKTHSKIQRWDSNFEASYHKS